MVGATAHHAHVHWPQASTPSTSINHPYMAASPRGHSHVSRSHLRIHQVVAGFLGHVCLANLPTTIFLRVLNHAARLPSVATTFLGVIGHTYSSHLTEASFSTHLLIMADFFAHLSVTADFPGHLSTERFSILRILLAFFSLSQDHLGSAEPLLDVPLDCYIKHPYSILNLVTVIMEPFTNRKLISCDVYFLILQANLMFVIDKQSL